SLLGHGRELEARLKEHSDHFIQLANERFIQEQTRSKAVLEQSKQSIEFQVENLQKELSKIFVMVSDFEKDRIHKFASLEEKLAQAAVATQGLSQITHELSSVIGNNQLRGLWGQRMAEDILRAAGLEEGIHYLKEKAQDTVSTRPDFTFLLPDDRKVHMDVKFPLNNYEALSRAEAKADQDRHSADFIRDVKNRIRELKKRDYVNPEEQTLDYLILFIPSEQVFGYIHRNAPTIMDEALSQKILLTSPYSLYGVLSIIRQAHDNFHFQRSANEILKLISAFLDDYENFKKRFTDVGESLDKTKEKYLEVSEKSFKRLDQRLKKLEDFRKGQGDKPELQSSAFLI
ncbi:MAG: DNA recombination protein RmuC, partial [Candidatus Omnitrophota bacterium]